MEYAGYKASKGIDWGAIGQSALKTYEGIKTAHEGYETAGQALYQAGKKAIDESDKMINSSLETFVGNGADAIRSQMLDLNKKWKSGEISGKEYRNSMNNITSDWGSYITSVKSLDDRVTEMLSRQQIAEGATQPAGSALEAELMNNALGLKDISDKKITIDTDGSLYITGANGSNTSIRSLTAMDNIIDNRIDLNSVIKNQTEDLGEFIKQELKKGGSTRQINDITQSDYYKKSEANMIVSIVNPNNPRSVSGILVDNSSGEYFYSFTDDQSYSLASKALDAEELAGRKFEDYQEKYEWQKEWIDKHVINVRQDANGVMQPVITKKHIDEANEVVRNLIRTQLDVSDVTDRGFSPSSSSSSSDSDGKKGYALYDTLANAWIDGNLDELNANLKNQTKYVITSGKGKYILNQRSTDVVGRETLSPVIETTQLSDLIPYYFGTGANARKEGERQRDAWRRDNYGTGGGNNQNEGKGDSILNSSGT